MKSLLFFTLLLTSLPAMAESQFQVNLVGSTTAAVYVDKAWINNAEAVEAKVSVSPASPAEGVTLKAYFYSADGKLVHTSDKPSDLNAGNGGTVPMPATYEPGKKYSFFFGIPAAIKKGPQKWKRVIIVFGKGDQMSAKIYPKDDLKKFSFPEKDFAK